MGLREDNVVEVLVGEDQVPLFDDVVTDQLVWGDDLDGNYNVKSGYKLLVQSTIDSMDTLIEEGWKWLWKIKAPPKTKYLLWRICRECLPSRIRLRGRHVQCPLTCPLCDDSEESDWHVFFGCAASQEAWRAANLAYMLTPQAQTVQSAKDFFLSMCRYRDPKEAGKAAALVWTIWNNRNNWAWNNEKEQGQQIGVKAMNFWHEWSALQEVNSPRVQQVQPEQLSWQPPSQGSYKCNVDAGIHAEASKTSAGWCVRDFRGQFMLGGSCWFHGRSSSSEGEAVALLNAMTELHQRGFSNVVFETDAQNLVYAIRRRSNGVSEFSSIIQKIRCLLFSNPGFEVKPIRRQANRVAHTLARAALSWSRRHVFDFIPFCINNLLHIEMN